jgi:uncharacterized repeat protein (TIGR01451 family)
VPGRPTAVTLSVGVAIAAGPAVLNVATVSTPGDANLGNNRSSDLTSILPVVDVAVTKSHSGTFAVGQTGVFVLTVSNAGNVPTSQPIRVIDDLPAGLSFVSATGSGWSCAATGSVVSCSSSTPLAPGASSTITLSVGVARRLL